MKLFSSKNKLKIINVYLQRHVSIEIISRPIYVKAIQNYWSGKMKE
jgi:hypothetical protein